jgi:2-phospho-L-lactate transferase/gluconeogenesis factor (CofD/UPF0052 family)
VRVYVCNVATQQGETAGFDLADHVEALERHTAPGIVDVVLANGEAIVPAAATNEVEAVRLRWPPAAHTEPRLVIEDIVDPANPHHHDPARLAAALMKVSDGAGTARRRSAVARTA